MSSFSKATPSFQEGAGQGVGLLQHSTKGPSGWAFAAGHFEAFFFCIFRLIFYQLSVRRGQGHAAQHLPWQRAGGKQQRSAPKSTFHSKKKRHQEGKKDPTEHLFWGEKKGRNPFPLSGHSGFHFQPDKAEPSPSIGSSFPCLLPGLHAHVGMRGCARLCFASRDRPADRGTDTELGQTPARP